MDTIGGHIGNPEWWSKSGGSSTSPRSWGTGPRARREDLLPAAASDLAKALRFPLKGSFKGEIGPYTAMCWEYYGFDVT